MGMTVEEYRKRMMDAFHNADCEELIALVVSPTEKEFRHLEWLLKTHYKTPKEQYDNRLKADMVATLTDIRSEFKEGLRCKGCCNNCVNACEDIPAGWFLDFIDAKINSLKENTDGNDY